MGKAKKMVPLLVGVVLAVIILSFIGVTGFRGEIGRYQIATTQQDGVYVIDTTTGEVRTVILRNGGVFRKQLGMPFKQMRLTP